MSYKILTDSCWDLPTAMMAELEVAVVPLTVNINGEIFEDGEIPVKEFYNRMRAGAIPTTSAVNPDGWAEKMKPALEAGDDVLVIAFSSGLSTTYQSAVIAADDLKEVYPDRKILVIDTLCASAGQGLLVWNAAKQRQAGKSIDEVWQWVMDNRNHVAHWVTVDDLTYLKRGGRISSATAVVGTMLSIKPIIHVDEEGKLASVAKARGRKAALNFVADKLGQTGLAGRNGTVFISHSDCRADAEYVLNVCKEKYGVKEGIISDIGDVIGSHAGPGTIAFCFLAENK